MKLCNELLNSLKQSKNLLAFSYGSDSTALFHVLLEEKIEFDLAMVNYKMRPTSNLEEEKAKNLALKFNKQIFVKTAPLFKGNFEKNARDFRYEFFQELCVTKGYTGLILAHNFNDHFEWFLMQLSKGAGLFELLGMKTIEKKLGYVIFRPLLFVSKDEILAFLKEKSLFYFLDESNEDEKYFRNFIRKNFSSSFVSKFSKGLKRSFAYLQEDKNKLYSEAIQEFKGLLICSKNESLIAKAFKQKGLVLSACQRKEMLKGDCVLSSKIGLVYKNEKAIVFVYEKCQKLPKNFKEECRKAKIPRLLRAYLFVNDIAPSQLNF